MTTRLHIDAPVDHDVPTVYVEEEPDHGVDAAAIVLRLVLGIVLLGHALQKLGWFEGGGYPTDMGSAAQFVQVFGYDHTHLMAWLVTLTEGISGVLLLLGLLTPLAVAGVMGIALQFIVGPGWHAGLFGNANAGGFENSLIMFAAAASLGFIGAGRYSLDELLPLRLRGLRWGLAALGLAVVVGLFVLMVFGRGISGTIPGS
jgi:putative oxidoreductase